MGYFAVSFALGITARNIGMTPWQAAIMSLTCVASAGQFAALNVIAAGSGCLEMAVTSLIVNLRYLLLSSSLSQKINPKTKGIHRFFMAYSVTDEIFGVSVAQPGYVSPFFIYGTAASSIPLWGLGSFLGASVGSILPEVVSSALSVALYGMFLAIIIPPARKDHFIAGLVIISMASSLAFSLIPVISEISEGFRIIILTIIIAGGAALLHPVDVGAEGSDTYCADSDTDANTDPV